MSKKLSELTADEYQELLLNNPEEAERLSSEAPNARSYSTVQTPSSGATRNGQALEVHPLNTYRNGQPESGHVVVFWKNGKQVAASGPVSPTGKANARPLI